MEKTKYIQNLWIAYVLSFVTLIQIKCIPDSWKTGISGIWKTSVTDIGKDNKKKVIVVMCDITRSLDTNSIQKVTDVALNILDKSPDVEVIFYPIDSNLYVDCILTKESYSGKRFAERSDLIENDRKKLRENIYRIYRNRNARESCILKGFNIAYIKFKQYSSPEKYDFHLVFLSDMLEYCKYYFGKLDLEKSNNYKTSLDNLKLYKPEFNLKEMNVQVTVVMTAYRQLPIDETLHREFWRQAFKHVGYDDKDFEKINFSTDLPREFWR